MLESWQANVGFQLIIDSGKVVRHVTKYVTNDDSSMHKGIDVMKRSIVRNTIKEGLRVRVVLKRVTTKLLGKRIFSKKRTCHLTLSILMVN